MRIRKFLSEAVSQHEIRFRIFYNSLFFGCDILSLQITISSSKSHLVNELIFFKFERIFPRMLGMDKE